MTKAALTRWIKQHYDLEEVQILLADGFESAFIGIVETFEAGGHQARALYDYEQCIQVLIDRDHMHPVDAYEYMDFNVTGAYVGPATPSFLRHRIRGR